MAMQAPIHDWLQRLLDTLKQSEYTGRVCLDFHRGDLSRKIERRMTEKH